MKVSYISRKFKEETKMLLLKFIEYERLFGHWSLVMMECWNGVVNCELRDPFSERLLF